MAREGHDRGIAPEKILSGIEQVTGPAERGAGLRPLKRIARLIGMARKLQSDEGVIGMLMAWGDTKLPYFRKL